MGWGGGLRSVPARRAPSLRLIVRQQHLHHRLARPPRAHVPSATQSHARKTYQARRLMWQKRRRGITPLLPDSLYPGSLPASSPSPKPSGRYGVEPLRMEILSRPCPLCVSRTPRQTSGLPAGTEPSFESRVILASTNSKNPAAFEEYQEKGLHLEYQPHPNTSRIHPNKYG